MQRPRIGYKLVKSLFGKYEEIPEDWDLDEIQNHTKISTGDKNTQDKIKDGKYPFFVRSKKIARINSYSYDGKSVLTAGDGDIGKIFHYIDGKFDFHQRVYKISDFDNVLDSYFFYLYFSNYFLNRAISMSAKNTVDSIRLDMITKMLIPLPSIQEQQKIASVLINIGDLIQKYDGIIIQTKRLKQGLMQKLLTKGIGHKKFKHSEIGKIPEDWKVVKMSDIATIKRGKFSHRPRGDPDYFGGTYPFIQTGDIEKSNGFILNHSQTLNEKGKSVSKIFPEGIIVITIVGANVGNTAITTYPVYFPDSIIGISSNKMDIGFLETFLQTKKKFFKNIAINNARENLNLKILENLIVPYMSLVEQKQIFSIFYNVDENIRETESKKSYLESLKKGLMQNLLTGKIRVKV